MGSEQKAKIGATTRSDLWGIPPENLYSPRSEKTHPEHEEWIERTRLDAPKMIALLESMRLNGTDEGEPVIYSRDGKSGRNIIADGDRRHAACTQVNIERKAAKPRKPSLVLRAVATQDPILARQLGNACRQDDPPMVLARRYRAAVAAGMERPAAAAANGLRLDYANSLLACLALPAEVQMRVNAGELPPDVAARAGKIGAAAALEVIEAAKDPSTGRVSPAKARKVAAANHTPRPKMPPVRLVTAFVNELARGGLNGEHLATLRRITGDAHAFDARPKVGDDPGSRGYPDLANAWESARTLAAKGGAT